MTSCELSSSELSDAPKQKDDSSARVPQLQSLLPVRPWNNLLCTHWAERPCSTFNLTSVTVQTIINLNKDFKFISKPILASLHIKFTRLLALKNWDFVSCFHQSRWKLGQPGHSFLTFLIYGHTAQWQPNCSCISEIRLLELN